MRKNQLERPLILIGTVMVLYVWGSCYQLWKKGGNRNLPSTPYLLLWTPLQNQWYPHYKIKTIPSNADKVSQIYLHPRTNTETSQYPCYLVYFPSCVQLGNLSQQLTIRPDADSNVYLFRTCYCREIHSKMSNWRHYTNYYGYEGASQIMPQSYRLDHYNDFQRFQKSQKDTKNSKWLVKLDIDKKQGLYLYHNLSKDTLQEISKQPSLLQRVQPDPLLVQGYRTSFRFYVASICRSDGINGLYLYHDGLVQYSLLPYDENSDNLNSLLAGYPNTPSLQFYQRHNLPRSYQKLLASNPTLQDNLHPFFQKVFRPFQQQMCQCEIDPDLKGNITRVHVYGADVGFHLVNGEYQPFLYELNSGPCQIYPENDWQKLILHMYHGLFQHLSILPIDNRYQNWSQFL